MLSSKDVRELVSLARQHISLTESVIEKDYYVTQVIHELSNIENEYFNLVFCGGTCLAKAHKLVRRMSEDVDFKIQFKGDSLNFTKSRILKELKEFRVYIKSKLMLTGLVINEPVVRNEGQYSRIEIEYPTIFQPSVRLRQNILLEFTISEIRLSIESLSIETLIEEVLKNIVISPKLKTVCISVVETAIEKWVGLTRRIMAIERGYHHDDKTLIRHVYDLNAIRQANKISDDFFSLAKAIVNHDSMQFKNQHPEYFDDPRSEIMQSLAILKSKPMWKERYQEFIETMVYDNRGALEYEEAMATLDLMSSKIINSLHLELV